MRKIERQSPPWEVRATVRDGGRIKPLVIRVTPYEIEIRQKGARRGYSLPWQSVWVEAALAAAKLDKAARKGKTK